jgi:signal recognition particle GTPase
VELLEISLVSIPANPRALISSKSFEDALEKEIVDELEIKDLQSFLDEFMNEQEAAKPVEKQVEKKADKEIINKDVKCECCDTVISKICPVCAENKATEDYFEKLYNDILTDRQEVSA